jgi:putative membrane protein
MIVRPQQHWFRRLFVWHGSVLPKILFRLSLNFAFACIAVVCYLWHELLDINLTLAPFSLLGVAIAIFLGFRNNASYARFTEARLLWGNLLITERSLLREVKSLMPDPAEQARYFTALLIAFTYCLKHQLRKTDMHGDLDRMLPASERNSVLNSHSPCNTLLLKMGMWLGEQRRLGRISDINFHSIDNNLNHLSSILGGCERISNTPIPFAYSLIVHRTVYLFCALLPFALVSDLHYLTPLVSVFISYTFISLDSLAEELEDPFGLAPNDLPLNAISATIEINLREMIEDDEKPTPMKPDHHCLLS